MRPGLCGAAVLMSSLLVAGRPVSTLGADQPPHTAVRPVTDTFGPLTVVDPYRWLEDPGAVETRDFVRAQNEFTQRYLAGTSERQRTRHWIRQRLETLASYEAASLPSRRGGRLYYLSNQARGAQPILMSRREGEIGRAHV